MSNKKRIRKLILSKYKPSRKTEWNWFLQYMSKRIPANTGRVLGKTDFINKINKEYLMQLQTTSRADFQREYLNDPIQTGVVHPAIVFIDYNLSEKELTAIVDKLERIRSDKMDPL